MTQTMRKIHNSYATFLYGIRQFSVIAKTSLSELKHPDWWKDAQVDDSIILESWQLAGGNTKPIETASMPSIFQTLKNIPITQYQQSVFMQPETLFPTNDNQINPANLKGLFEQFVLFFNQLEHRNNATLFLDQLDSLWLLTAQGISAGRNSASLYDVTKVASAIASALSETSRDSEKPLLMIQGDFQGIQNMIFAGGSESQRYNHKLLRGRSFYVSLLSECSALSILQTLQLPPNAMVMNAAGKWLVIAPNNTDILEKVSQAKKQMNAWCLKQTYGEIVLNIASLPVSLTDLKTEKFKSTITKIFESLDIAKHQSYDLINEDPKIFSLSDFEKGQCEINGRLPIQTEMKSANKEKSLKLSKISKDQIQIGEWLTKRNYIQIFNTDGKNTEGKLSQSIFGFDVFFTDKANINSNEILRVWDVSIAQGNCRPSKIQARRFINGYVPCFDEEKDAELDKYGQWKEDVDFDREYPIKTLHHIACEDKQNLSDKWIGETGLVTVKGDIDNLGTLFQEGFTNPSMAKHAQLSRQLNLFFAFWLPWYCKEKNPAFRNIYTVFAGGDDFFLIGPWKTAIQFVGVLQQEFKRYIGGANITFSVGLVMTKPKVPARHLARIAEEALDDAKSYQNQKYNQSKNAVGIWDQTVSFDDWHSLMQSKEKLETLMLQSEKAGAPFSSGMVYSMLSLAEMANDEQMRPENSLWRSQLHYRLTRLIRDRIRNNEALSNQIYTNALNQLTTDLNRYRGAYRLPLSILLYGKRE